MNKRIASFLLVSLSALSAGQALAAEPAGLTRAQVLAELEQARKDGTLIVDNEAGLTAREVRPDLYPSAASNGKTRAEVLAELKAAGNAPRISDLGD